MEATKRKEAKFQLHHTGIKTKEHGESVCFRVQFQLHHTGIKTGRDIPLEIIEKGISIAPYRN